MNNLVVCAHPDDELLSMAGTIAKLTSSGQVVDILFCFEGSSSRYDVHCESRILEDIELRENMATSSCNSLGVNSIKFIRSKNFYGSYSLGLELSKFIYDYSEELNSQRVFTHWPGDLNYDHIVTSQSVLAAFRPVRSRNCDILFFEVLSSTEWASTNKFSPNCYSDIGMHLDIVKSAFEAYSLELRKPPHPRNFETYIARARLRGSENFIQYADAFHIHRYTLH